MRRRSALHAKTVWRRRRVFYCFRHAVDDHALPAFSRLKNTIFRFLDYCFESAQARMAANPREDSGIPPASGAGLFPEATIAGIAAKECVYRNNLRAA